MPRQDRLASSRAAASRGIGAVGWRASSARRPGPCPASPTASSWASSVRQPGVLADDLADRLGALRASRRRPARGPRAGWSGRTRRPAGTRRRPRRRTGSRPRWSRRPAACCRSWSPAPRGRRRPALGVLVEQREVEVELAREVLVEHRLADAGALGDVVHRRRVVALGDEDLLGGAEQLLAPGRPGQPGAAGPRVRGRPARRLLRWGVGWRTHPRRNGLPSAVFVVVDVHGAGLLGEVGLVGLDGLAVRRIAVGGVLDRVGPLLERVLLRDLDVGVEGRLRTARRARSRSQPTPVALRHTGAVGPVDPGNVAAGLGHWSCHPPSVPARQR